VVTADWGMRYPLRVLAPAGQRDKIRDFWLVFREYGKGDGRGLYKEWFADRTVVVVSYHAAQPVFGASDANWRGFAQKHLEPRGNVAPTQEQRRALLHPDDLPAVIREYADAIRERRPSSTQFRVHWPDGSWHWLASRSTAVQRRRPARRSGPATARSGM